MTEDKFAARIDLTPDEAQTIRKAYVQIYHNAVMVCEKQRRAVVGISNALYATGVFLAAEDWKSDVETVLLFVTEAERQALVRFALACRQFCSIAPGAEALEPFLSSVFVKAHLARTPTQKLTRRSNPCTTTN